MIIRDENKYKDERAKPFTAKRLREILNGIEPESLVMFEDMSKKSKSKNGNGKELIKDIIVQKQEYPNNNGEVAYQVILINEFLNLNMK